MDRKMNMFRLRRRGGTEVGWTKDSGARLRKGQIVHLILKGGETTDSARGI